ncbi:hypothetical protein [Romboutsia sp.]|uniref:hypothetical protein n=1 Tax=Romboutsia sp. TaxID=1965302 RepID=UPI003F35BD95
MKVEVIASKRSQKEAKRYILSKLPLVSKVAQFNSVIGEMHLEYIEFKVLRYEIISKKKSNKIFRRETKKYVITMLVNTYNGHSESIDNIPQTFKRYVAKSCIKKAKVNDEEIITVVKDEILYFFRDKAKIDIFDKINIQEIKTTEVRSIYKPYWVADFRGRSILVEA